MTARSRAVMFLPCDMPLLSSSLLRRMAGRYRTRPHPMFASTSDGVGFPLIIPASALPTIRSLLAAGVRSLQQLAGVLQATVYRVPPNLLPSFANINTPSDFIALDDGPGSSTRRLVSPRSSK